MRNNRFLQSPSFQKVLGDIGELFVQEYLSNHSDSYTKADKVDFLAQHLLQEALKEDFDYNIAPIR